MVQAGVRNILVREREHSHLNRQAEEYAVCAEAQAQLIIVGLVTLMERVTIPVNVAIGAEIAVAMELSVTSCASFLTTLPNNNIAPGCESVCLST